MSTLTFSESSLLQDPEQQNATLQLIDERQDHVLEDLERLNQQIINIIEVHTNNRASVTDADNSDTGDQPQDAAA